MSASSHPEPPETLEQPLELDPSEWSARQSYLLMTSLVIPRPIAWVSTLSPDGVPNLAPYSYFNLVCADPPHVMFSSTGVKDSLRNIRATGEFVLNLATVSLAEQLNFSSADFPAEQSEFRWTGLAQVAAQRVAPPRVAESPAHLECRLAREVPVGRDSHVVIGEVVHVHVDPALWSEGRVQPERLDPLCRLAGSAYAQLGERFSIDRPSWERVSQAESPQSAIPRRRPAGATSGAAATAPVKLST